MGCFFLQPNLQARLASAEPGKIGLVSFFREETFGLIASGVAHGKEEIPF
jgi:hypothetical protein